MENNNRTVFDRLDSIEAQNTELMEAVKNIQKQSVNASQVQQANVIKPQMSEQELLKIFKKKSKKEYFWFGTGQEFSKSKNLLIASCVALIFIGIISTILTSIAFNLYSTFTLFENIWVFASCFILSHGIKTKKIMQDIDLKEHSCDKFIQDADGTWRDTDKEKKRYKWFRRISYFSVIFNIVGILTISSGGLVVAATIFEILFFGITLTASLIRNDFDTTYGFIIVYTGRNMDNTQTVKAVFDVMEKKLFLYEDYMSMYKQMLE
jgi:hypothetical protein